MKVTLTNHCFSIADAVINKIAENPYKFPRPSGTSGTTIVDGSRLPAVKFVPMMTFLFERSMEFLLQRYLVQCLAQPEGGGLPFRRTVYIFPWAFSCTITRITELSPAELGEVIKDKERWSRFFFLEISGVELRGPASSKPKSDNP